MRGITRWIAIRALLPCGLVVGVASPTAAQDLGQGVAIEEECRRTPRTITVDEVLRRAAAATGMRNLEVLRYHSVRRTTMDFQSDRSYAPYFSAFDVVETRFDAETGVEWSEGEFVYPAMGPTPPRRTASSHAAAFLFRGHQPIPFPGAFQSAEAVRNLNPLAVLRDWSDTGEPVDEGGECFYRDDWRTVLARSGLYGPERLFLDRESGFPVKLDRTEGEATWGQRRAEYLWSTWVQADGAFFPTASFKIVDGRIVLERTVGTVEATSWDDSEPPDLPPAPPMTPDPWLHAWSGAAPDTVRIAEDTFLLAHPAYNSLVTAVDETVYLLDATVNEARARQDSSWIARLFPTHERIRVLVTDLAWPHVGGVRFWVARGAEILSHPQSEAFLRELVERRWTLRPDALEAARSSARFAFTPVDDRTELAGGAVRVVPLEGIGNEGAFVVHLRETSFLWAGDWIQDVEKPTLYARDVLDAVSNAGIEPERVAAQHLPITRWQTVSRVNAR